MVKARRWIVKRPFVGDPKREDFEIVEEVLPPLKNGQILVKTEFCGVDPYLRTYKQYMMPDAPYPHDQFSYNVGLIIESKHPKYPVGKHVASHKGWRDYTIMEPKPTRDMYERIHVLPDMKGLSPSLGIGAVGVAGVSAYYGLLDYCQPKAGETLVVTSAAGNVGILVGQIGKILGLRVIGFAGSDSKVQWLEKELGFDKAINYKTPDVSAALKAATPNGVDCYFDNVGGQLSSIIISQMNSFGRISVCGALSTYNEVHSKMPQADALQMWFLAKQLKMQGWMVKEYPWEKWVVAMDQIIKWIKSGQLKPVEQILEGFENLFDAFRKANAGEFYGKPVVKV